MFSAGFYITRHIELIPSSIIRESVMETDSY